MVTCRETGITIMLGLLVISGIATLVFVVVNGSNMEAESKTTLERLSVVEQRDICTPHLMKNQWCAIVRDASTGNEFFLSSAYTVPIKKDK